MMIIKIRGYKMKKTSVFALIICLISTVYAQEEKKTQVLNAAILSGPSCIPVCKIVENPVIDDIQINFEKFATPQNLLPKLVKKEIDLAFLPVNVAAKVFNTANKNIVCLAVTGNGNIFLITKDTKVNKISDLSGKKVQVAGQGATPDYLFRYLLQQNEINDNEIFLDYSVPNAQIAAQLISGKIDYAVVPEPFVTIAKTKSKDVRVAVDFQQEYKFFSDGNQNYPLTVMIARKEFAQNNQEIIDKFLKEYEKSLEWTLKNPAAAGKLCETLDFSLAANVVAKSIPNSNYTFIRAVEAKTQIEELLTIFMNLDKASVGQVLPSDDFYFSVN